MENILSEILKQITPSEKEKHEALNLFKKIQKEIKSKYNLDSDLMGSVAKNTFLKGNKDLDIFVFFPKSTPREDLEKKALEIGEYIFKKFKGTYEISYAEHPYIKGVIGGHKVEIVPAYHLKDSSEKATSVDRTPFHKEFVLKNLKNPEQVLLLKQFLKANNIYGSELKTKGFSGYLCELLIIKYKTFENLIRNASNFKKPQLIYINPPSKELKTILKEHKHEPLIFLDPVDENRNVAAVLSLENYSKFVLLSKLYMKKPSISFFQKQKPNIINLKKILNNMNYTIILFEKPDLIEDILYPKLEKIKNQILKQLIHYEFTPQISFVFTTKKYSGIFIQTKEKELSEYKEQQGPKVWISKHNIFDFLNKHKNTYIKDDKIYALEKRTYTTPEELIKNISTNPPFKLASINTKLPKDIEETNEFWENLDFLSFYNYRI